jgi:hypothetical protein
MCGFIPRWNPIPLTDLPIKKVAFAQSDFFNGKNKFIILFCKVCVVQPSGFGMCVLDNQEEFMMTINSKYLAETKKLKV